MKRRITKKQAALLKPVRDAKVKTDLAWLNSLVLMGLEDEQVAGAFLDGEEPYILIRDQGVVDIGLLAPGKGD